MSKQVTFQVIFGLAALSARAAAEPPLLSAFGQLCDPGPEWQAVQDDRPAATRPLRRADYFVFAKKSTAERLIIAVYPSAPTDNRDLIYYSDSALEMPADGYPSNTFGATTTSFRNRVVDLRAKSSPPVQALEYTFVRETPQQRNRMANGYVMRLNNRTVFVQHSSDTPITGEFAREMATQLVEKS
jgi:hypothetical protein